MRPVRGLGERLAVLVGLVAGLIAGPAAAQEVPRVTLVLSDSFTEPAAAAIREMLAADPSLRERVRIHVFPSTSSALIDVGALRASQVVVFNVHGVQLVEDFRGELEGLVERGAVVYGVGGTPLEGELREMGLRFDARVLGYYQEGGKANLENLARHLLETHLGFEETAAPPRAMPERGVLDVRTGATYETFDAFLRDYPGHRPGRPWVGVTLLRNYVVSGQIRHVAAVVAALEERGFNVLPIFGFPEPDNLATYFFEPDGRSRVEAVVGMSLRLGVDPVALGEVLDRLGVPVVNAISLSRQSVVEWRDDPVGIEITERTWQVANPELGGLIAPTVVAAKEPVADPELGLEYLEFRPIEERVERLADRVAALVRLRTTPNADKRVALVYYNYPPGKENIGASYLNVLPESLVSILESARAAGFDVGERSLDPDSIFRRVMDHGRNVASWAPAEMGRLLEGGEAVRIPVSRYREWFDALPAAFRDEVTTHWGPPESAGIMTWRDPDDAAGELHLVLPVVRAGSLLLAAQPLRAEPHAPEHAHHHDPTHDYHSADLPPHHQYVAFYLWLRHEWDAHAVVHVGTHGTLEWLPGKEVGFAEDDAPEVLLGPLPNVNPYIVDNVGEGLQAKRRGMATIVDHMTPPFGKAGLDDGLADVLALIDDHNVAVERSPAVAEIRRQEINDVLGARGLLVDLGLEEVRDADQMEEVEHYLRGIDQASVPFGLHVFGRSPSAEATRAMAEAITSRDPDLPPSERAARLAEIEDRITASGPRESASLIAALEGSYVPAGSGNDPLRNPASLPTGKNFFAFNPGRIPTEAIYAEGARLSMELLDDYRKRHGAWPERLTYNLWSTETIRHEGIVESQVLHLLGVRPVRDPRGTVTGVEPIPRGELGRPRVDVTVISSGLYRDLFPNLIRLLDGAAAMAIAQDEADNHARLHMLAARRRLEGEGIDPETATRLASVRVFGTAPGMYGTGLEDVIVASDSWESEQQVASVFFGRMSHAYGQGFWGERPEEVIPELEARRGLGVELLEGALAGTRIAVHSRSTNLYGVLDTDDFYQYLGGTALAIRTLDGNSPEIYISNLMNPAEARQEGLARFMGHEMRTRYLNPAWIEAMTAEGYAGARFFSRVVSHLWGWQVTVPDAVTGDRWQEFYETYVEDRNELGLREFFREENHAWAYQTMVARMLETARRGYWDAPAQVMDRLAGELAASVASAGAACNALVCNNQELLEFAMARLETVPAGSAPSAEALARAISEARGGPPLVAVAEAAPAVDGAGEPASGEAAPADPADVNPAPETGPAPVEGYLMERVDRPRDASAVAHGSAIRLFRAGMLLLFLALLVGWFATGRGWRAA